MLCGGDLSAIKVNDVISHSIFVVFCSKLEGMLIMILTSSDPIIEPWYLEGEEISISLWMLIVWRQFICLNSKQCIAHSIFVIFSSKLQGTLI